jgi:hypothetical protein
LHFVVGFGDNADDDKVEGYLWWAGDLGGPNVGTAAYTSLRQFPAVRKLRKNNRRRNIKVVVMFMSGLLIRTTTPVLHLVASILNCLWFGLLDVAICPWPSL